jgi:hypothetical protein
LLRIATITKGCYEEPVDTGFTGLFYQRFEGLSKNGKRLHHEVGFASDGGVQDWLYTDDTGELMDRACDLGFIVLFVV